MRPNQQYRVKRLKDDPTIGHGPAMFSASGKPIQLDDVLYQVGMVPTTRPNDDDDYDDDDDDDDDEDQDIVRAVKVIQLNYHDRYVRVRCSKGCESTIPFAEEGCNMKPYYHTQAEAIKAVEQTLTARGKELTKDYKTDTKKYENEMLNIKQAIAGLKKVEVKQPN